jgi:toxin ParE1/3/4
MSSCVFTRQAHLDLLEIHDYIAADNPAAAARFVQKMERKCQTIARTPMMGRLCEELEPLLRCFSVDNYIIFYKTTSNGVAIIRILSGYRDYQRIFVS